QVPPQLPVSGFVPQGGGGTCPQLQTCFPLVEFNSWQIWFGSLQVPPHAPPLSGCPPHGSGRQVHAGVVAAACLQVVPARHTPPHWGADPLPRTGTFTAGTQIFVGLYFCSMRTPN